MAGGDKFTPGLKFPIRSRYFPSHELVISYYLSYLSLEPDLVQLLLLTDDGASFGIVNPWTGEAPRLLQLVPPHFLSSAMDRFPRVFAVGRLLVVYTQSVVQPNVGIWQIATGN